MPLSIEPISPAIGARISVAAADLLADDNPRRIMEALDRYNVIVFPQIDMSDEQFLGLTGALGHLQEQSVTADGSEASDKGIYRIALDKDDKTQRDFVKGNDFWHMDGTSYEKPGKATMLKCEQPPAEGGDTGVANLFAAYAALPDAMKARLEGLRVIHCLEAVGLKMYDAPTEEDFARWNAVFPPLEHPLVWHQKDGRTALLIGSTARRIVGMEEAEGHALLAELLDWSTQDRFTYRHRWQKGDVVIFNNPGCLHRSFPYDESAGRVMHRTTLVGLEAAA